jgi:hypothetical protein
MAGEPYYPSRGTPPPTCTPTPHPPPTPAPPPHPPQQCGAPIVRQSAASGQSYYQFETPCGAPIAPPRMPAPTRHARARRPWLSTHASAIEARGAVLAIPASAVEALSSLSLRALLRRYPRYPRERYSGAILAIPAGTRRKERRRGARSVRGPVRAGPGPCGARSVRVTRQHRPTGRETAQAACLSSPGQLVDARLLLLLLLQPDGADRLLLLLLVLMGAGAAAAAGADGWWWWWWWCCCWCCCWWWWWCCCWWCVTWSAG